MTVREIPITVKAEFVDAQAVDRDKPTTWRSTRRMRSAGNITLPSAGEFGSTITWQSSSDLITPTGEVTRPAFGRPGVAGNPDGHDRQGRRDADEDVPLHDQALPREEE